MDNAYILMRAYNAEKTIEKAIDSAINQDYENINIIVLDDGSTDKTADIVKSYNNSKISYVKQENKGPAGTFISIAKETLKRCDDKDYVFFLDSDDSYTKQTAVSSTINRMKETDANLCIIGMEFTGDEKFILQPDAGKKHLDLVARLGSEKNSVNIRTAPHIIDADTMAWTKVYKGDMFKKYINMLPEFAPDLKVCEDFPATATLLFKDSKVTANPEVFYNFYKRSDSITSTPTIANFERDRIEFIKMTQELYTKNPDEFFPEAKKYINDFVMTKYNIISGIVENKVKGGDLVGYSKEQFQKTFKERVSLMQEISKKDITDSILKNHSKSR